MFRCWLNRNPWRWSAVLMDAPDAGSGGGPGANSISGEAGSQPANDTTEQVDDDAQGAERSATPGAGETDDDEPLEALIGGDDDDQPARPAEERIRALSGKVRKMLRRITRMDPVYRRVKDVDLDDVLIKARRFDELEQLRVEDPDRFRQLLGVETAPAARGRASDADTRTEADADLIDLTKLPFDPKEHDVNGWLHTLATKVNDQARELRQLRQEARGITQRYEEESASTRARSWNGAVEAAAKQIEGAGLPKGVVKLFRDNLELARRQEEGKLARKARGRLTPTERIYTAEQVIRYYLRELGIDAQVQRRANEAARQRGAERTAALSRQQTGAGAPAAAAGDRRLTMATARQRLLSR